MSNDSRLASTLDMLERLVRFDTESSKTNLPLVAAVEAYLQERGVAYVIVPDSKGDKAALFATIGPMVDGGIILSGHTDVVPVAGQNWSSDPYRLRRDGDRLFGRGACDMKSFCAAALAMVDEFMAAPLERPIHILLSYDEETTCLGPVATIERFGLDLPRPRAAFVGEPTSMQVADSHKSISTYRTIVHGHEAHSAKPALGANAIEAACALVGELYSIAAKLPVDPTGRFDPPNSTVSVGKIEGGTARNILARQCTFLWEFRGLPGVPANTVLARLEAFAAANLLPSLKRKAPAARIETSTEIEIPSLSPEPGSAAVTLALKLRHSNRTIAVSYASEAGRFQAAGIPTVLCGPGNIDQAHQPDEYIEVSEIEACLGFMRDLTREMA